MSALFQFPKALWPPTGLYDANANYVNQRHTYTLPRACVRLHANTTITCAPGTIVRSVSSSDSRLVPVYSTAVLITAEVGVGRRMTILDLLRKATWAELRHASSATYTTGALLRSLVLLLSSSSLYHLQIIRGLSINVSGYVKRAGMKFSRRVKKCFLKF